MLTTTGFRNFGIEMDSMVNDATVTFLPGTALIANSLVPWSGKQTQLNAISTFSGNAGWQNVLLYLYIDSTNVGPDMTYSRSVVATSQAGLNIPSMASNGQPISLFTFMSLAGNDSTLISYTQ